MAHSCYDYRTPGKKDDVSFAVTRIDEERGVAVGIITRIIRQNLWYFLQIWYKTYGATTLLNIVAPYFYLFT